LRPEQGSEQIKEAHGWLGRTNKIWQIVLMEPKSMQIAIFGVIGDLKTVPKRLHGRYNRVAYHVFSPFE
jgi:hypothetical protein